MRTWSKGLNQSSCIFCELPKSRIAAESDLFLVILDGFPVTEDHTLIIPKRHVETWFDLTEQEQQAANQLLSSLREQRIQKDSSITGFNIGMNCGESAGQTVMHCHIHLIPRRDGDCESPRGGVRGVIAGKQSYSDES